ncbi:hypothetical protein Emed_006592 [Eimeria media]
MEQQSGKLARDLTAAEFDPLIFERMCTNELVDMKLEEKAELLTWLQEKAAETKNDSEKRSANIHVCLCQLWENVRDCTRSEGSLDAQLYEAQLAQLASSSSLVLCSLCQVAYNANAVDMTLTVLDNETEDRMHLLEFCCEHNSVFSCRHTLDLASRLPSPNLLSALADLLVFSLQRENERGLKAAATEKQSEEQEREEARETGEFERLLRQILESWKDMQKYEKEKEPKAALALCEAYAGLTVLDSDEREGEEGEQTRLLLRLHALVLLNRRKEALEASRFLAESKRLTADEACALCSECFANSETSPDIALECLFLLLTSLVEAATQRSDEATSEVASGLVLPASQRKDTCSSKLLYVAAFTLQKSQEAANPRAAAIRLTRVLVSLSIAFILRMFTCMLFFVIAQEALPDLMCNNAEPEAASYIQSFCSAEGGKAFQEAHAAADIRSKHKTFLECVSTAGEIRTETLAVPQLAATTDALEALQKELRIAPSKSKAVDNLLRLAFLLEFEGRCLLTREEKERGKKGSFEGSSETATTPKMMADRATKEELLGPAGTEMLFSTALEIADEETITLAAHGLLKTVHQWEGRDLAFVASGLRRAICMERRREAKLELMRHLAESIFCFYSTAWNQGVSLFRLQRHREAEQWMRVAVTLERAREGLLPQQQQEGMMEAAYAQCMRLAEEQRRFFEQSYDDLEQSGDEDSESSDSE